MPGKTPLIVGIGELLWDVLPGNKHLGGAPANFIYHSSQLGSRAALISRIGNDELGSETLASYAQLGLDTSHIQIDTNHKTGTVEVEVDSDGQPTFNIMENSAWDFIAFNPQACSLVRNADMLYFGSLAQRSKESRRSIVKYLKTASAHTIKLFDVNLRADYYTTEIIRDGLVAANIVKLNEDELDIVLDMLTHADKNGKYTVADMIDEYEINLLCITMGSRGCELKTAYETVIHRGMEVEVKDTIGAGDAFTAAVAINYLAGKSLEKIAYAANLLGSYVASQRGATPHISQKILEQVGLRYY
jgi:fructokinase